MPFGSVQSWPHKPFRWSGAEGGGSSGYSGFSGFGSGNSGQSGISGWSGFSGEGASAYQWTNRAYVPLDEYKTWTPNWPSPDPPDPPESDTLNIALEANQTYVLSGNLVIGLRANGTFIPGPNYAATNWKYTGTAANFALSFFESGDPIIGYAVGNTWVSLNTVYSILSVSPFYFQIGGDKDGTLSSYRAMVIKLSGTIETTTAGILTFCVYPYDLSYPAWVTADAVIYRGSYMEAFTLGGAASGCSGFSGKDAIIRVGTFTGI